MTNTDISYQLTDGTETMGQDANLRNTLRIETTHHLAEMVSDAVQG